jgi:parvulin-like peptidyl-prolyl isomerase
MPPEITDPNTDLDPTPPTFDEQLEDVFARRFAPEESNANDDGSEPTEGIPHPAESAEPPAGTADPAPAVDPVQPPAADPALDTAPAAEPATGEPARPGAVDFDPATFGVAETDPGTPPPPPAPSVLTIPTPDGGTFDLDVQTAESLLALGAWSQNLAPDVREAFAAIEQGQAVAISRQDYERFAAWSQTQAAEQYDDLDPQVAQRLAALEQENARLRSQPIVNQHVARTDQAIATFDDTAAQYAAQRGLTPDEMSQVFSDAINAGVITSIAESLRTYSPTGDILRDADYAEVARRAFDFALIQDPDLHTRVLHRAADRNPIATGEPTAPAVDPTAIKKARAGSLASAPSAAVSHPPVDPRNMSPEALRAAMTDEIRAAMAAG